MKIQSAQVHMQGAHAASRQLRTEERVQVSVAVPARQSGQAAPPVGETVPSAAPEDLEARYLELLIEVLSGRDVQIVRVAAPGADATATGSSPDAPAAQVVVSRSTSEHYSESETSAFAASVSVQTGDGGEREIGLSLLMQRRFESNTTVTQTSGNRQDPLLLNLHGNAPELGASKYAFDLNADGTNESLSLPTGASAFLALDRNGDGRIGDGSELFGALSGDGFAELARHDDDGNGFIDGGDAVFGQLLAWRKDAQGNDALASLASLGVGALYLGSVATPFELKTATNETLGVVRRTGLWIGEHAGAGTLQQLDLVV